MPESEADFGNLIRPILSRLELELTSEQVAQLSKHYATLRRWNRRINLTGITRPQEVAERHFGESLFVAKSIKTASGTLVDIGSGAGFPGLPLAIVKPSFQVTLVESVGKKVTFLKEVARSVENVTVFHGRFEYLETSFDWATVRALAPRPLLEHLRRVAGHVALLIGQSDLQDILASPLFEWDSPAELPWSRASVLLVGNRRACST